MISSENDCDAEPVFCTMAMHNRFVGYATSTFPLVEVEAFAERERVRGESVSSADVIKFEFKFIKYAWIYRDTSSECCITVESEDSSEEWSVSSEIDE